MAVVVQEFIQLQVETEAQAVGVEEATRVQQTPVQALQVKVMTEEQIQIVQLEPEAVEQELLVVLLLEVVTLQQEEREELVKLQI